MSAQSIVGWLVILSALGVSIWKLAPWRKGARDFPLRRFTVALFTGTLLNYILVWFAWSMTVACSLLTVLPWLDRYIDWAFRALFSPWQWLFGLIQ